MAIRTESFTLTKPLNTHDGEKTDITLKTPTMSSFIKYGMPFQYVSTRNGDDSVTVEVKWSTKAMAGFLSDMTGLDDIVLSGLSAPDTMTLYGLAKDLIENP